MGLRRGKTTPYEVMRQRQREAAQQAEDPAAESPDSSQPPTSDAQPQHAAPAPEPEYEPEPAPSPAPPFSLAILARWFHAGEPIVLRVPRGVAVIAGLGFIALIASAFALGSLQSPSPASADAQAETSPRPAPDPPPSLQAEGSTQTSAHQPMQPEAASDTPAEHATTDDGGDPREPGLNYMVLALYPEDHANRLADFLAQRGVETVLVPTSNDDLYQVWAVSRGFTAQEYGGPDWQEYRNQLRSYGRQWREFNDGHGDSLESMYGTRYDGSR